MPSHHQNNIPKQNNSTISINVDGVETTIQQRTYNVTSREIRDLLISEVIDNGELIKTSAERLHINYWTARRIIAEFKKKQNKELSELFDSNENAINTINEELENTRGRPKLVTHDLLNEIDNFVMLYPSSTLKEIKEHIATTKHICLSIGLIHKALQRLKITLKVSNRLLDRVNSETTLAARENYARNFNLITPIDNTKVIFIDESGFNLHLTRRFARSRSGTRAPTVVPTIRSRNVSLILAANASRIIHYKIVDNSTCNRSIFATFCQELIAKIQQANSLHGCLIIADNATIHRTEEVRSLPNTEFSTYTFLSPYSYMLNPVEQIFSKIKSVVRSNMLYRSELPLVESITNRIEAITSEDCSNYYNHMLRNIGKTVDMFIFD